jgi:hypothetical protein
MRELQPDLVNDEVFEACMRAPGEPLVLRGAIEHWPAARKWSLQHFSDGYGDAPIELADCLLRPQVRTVVSLREYLEYVQRPEGTALAKLAADNELKSAFYAYGCKPFGLFPELRKDFQMPAYAHNWCDMLPADLRENVYPHGEPWLLFSGKGARSMLHRDDGHTIAWFAQIEGEKSFVVHPHAELPFMYQGRVDPNDIDLAQFPDYARAHATRFTVGPGDLVFLPPDWYHYVRTESPSITLTGNLVNHTNFGDYVQFAYGKGLESALGAMPSRP